MALTALAYALPESERQPSKDGQLLSIGAAREAVTEVIVFMRFALGNRFPHVRPPPFAIHRSCESPSAFTA
jgi:hypothetical protein